MKILFLSQRFLLPMDTGGKIRTGNILSHLSKKHAITLVSNVESPYDDAYLDQIDRLCSSFIAVAWKEVKRTSPLFYCRLFLQMFSVYPVSVLKDTSKRLREAVETEINNGGYDIAICDFVQSALMFRRVKGMPTILFQHNVESIIARRHMEAADHPIAKLFWTLQWKKMHRFERMASRQFTSIIAVSEQDKTKLQKLYGLDNVSMIPTGVDTGYFKPMPHLPIKNYSIAFCGSMDWLPNEDAMLFFIREVFPGIRRRVPDATLTIVGRNPSPALKRFVAQLVGVRLTGRVDDIRPFIAQASIVVVPLRIGGGTRLKIFEAMAMGKAVVSTAIGAEGLPVVDGETMIMVDEPHQMSERIVALLNDAGLRERLGNNALEFVRKAFAWSQVAGEFEKCCIEAHLTTNKRN